MEAIRGGWMNSSHPSPVYGRPHNAPKHTGTMLKLARLQRTVGQNCSASLPSKTFCSYKQMISLASLTSLWRVWLSTDKRTGSESWHQWCTMQLAKRVDLHVKVCCLASKKYRNWPKNGLRSNLIAPTFFWGSMPPDPLCVLAHALQTWPLQIWWLRLCVYRRGNGAE